MKLELNGVKNVESLEFDTGMELIFIMEIDCNV